MNTPPKRPAVKEEVLSPRVTGPFCEAFQEADPTEECEAFARVTIYLRPRNRLGCYCTPCWARMRPTLRFFYVEEIGGFAPPKN